MDNKLRRRPSTTRYRNVSRYILELEKYCDYLEGRKGRLKYTPLDPSVLKLHVPSDEEIQEFFNKVP